MELQDYRTALRRYWRTWVGVTLAGALAALAVVLAAPPTYKATAEVFVASSGTGTSGWQFVNQRVMSYPDIAASRTVLDPVIQQLGLQDSFAALSGRVTAVNPTGTSQIQITVADSQARRAADVANAVANRFGTVVMGLEKPAGADSPVDLTVTNPATPPSTPAFPVPSVLLVLGSVVGLLLGVAGAILRGRRDTRLNSEDDVRAAWGDDADELTVHAPLQRNRRSRRSPLASWPATMLARQLEPRAEDGPVRVVAISPSEDDRGARSFLDDVAAGLQSWTVPVHLLERPPAGPRRPDRPGVELVVGTPLAPLRNWRDLARTGAGVVVVVEPGRVEAADLREVRSILAAAGIRLLAIVLHARGRAGSTAKSATSGAAPAGSAVENRPEKPVPAGRG
ncbi:MAG: Capsular exopolysaccharide family [Frankiales bacterium]|nr:Capsular exopolysaccharide family [Frankiales bacterium]